MLSIFIGVFLVFAYANTNHEIRIDTEGAIAVNNFKLLDIGKKIEISE
jgi:hypothetical protein